MRSKDVQVCGKERKNKTKGGGTTKDGVNRKITKTTKPVNNIISLKR